MHSTTDISSSDTPLYVSVIVPVPLNRLFTYSVPPHLAGMAQPFVRARVPFGKTKTHTALIVSVDSNAPGDDFEVKDILEVLDERPVLLPSQWQLWQWMAEYYMAPLGDILVAALPQGLKREGAWHPRTETYITLCDGCREERTMLNAIEMLKRSPKQQQVFMDYLRLSQWDHAGDATSHIKEVTREELMNHSHATSAIINQLVQKGLMRLYDVEVGRLNVCGDAHPENIKPLTEAQEAARAALAEGNTCATGISLLHGVTSSGKTEVYIHLIQQAIDRGEQVMYLLPEIALTVQITQRLQHVFGSRLGIYHSKYSDAERVEIWQKQLGAEPYDIILGARSAVFLPYQRLGLVIVDEEHETSFKQYEPSPRYHARSVAIMMAQWAKAKVVLGTATPSAETYHLAMRGVYNLVTLNKRYKDLQLPSIEVVDVKDLRHRRVMRGLLSPQLIDAVRDALGHGEQAILFQNRRGYAPVIMCHNCGWTPRCPNCDVSLTYHKMMSTLTCHYCGHAMRWPTECPDCHNPDLRDRGAGTEKIEDLISELFPQARIARMDLDTTHTRNAYERIISEFAQGRTNLLIGTQMVTKGLDFDNVSVVGILSADTMLNQPDFRAWEHAFMMMTQVAGRAGRKGRRGRVILQTTQPQLPVIGQVVRNDFAGFFRDLMRERSEFHYPPFTRLIYVYLKHKDEGVVVTAATELGSRLRQVFKDRVLGPDKPAVARVKLMCIRKIVLKLETSLNQRKVREALWQQLDLMMRDDRYKSLQVYFDVDPA